MDSKVPDAQAAYETAITALYPALAGVNLIYGLGMLELGVTMDYAQCRAFRRHVNLKSRSSFLDSVEIGHNLFLFFGERHSGGNPGLFTAQEPGHIASKVPHDL